MPERKFTPPTGFPDFTKRTVGGLRAHILSANGEGMNCMVGQVLDEAGVVGTLCWDKAGYCEGGSQDYHLCDPEPTVKHQIWLNINKSGWITAGDSRTNADLHAGNYRIAVLRIDWMSDGTVRTEMEGL